MPRFDISSSEIRRRLAGGQSIDYLVPSAVAQHLRDAGIYRSSQVPA
jgi:nicotinic acid mononucleotide adenylyltransferase